MELSHVTLASDDGSNLKHTKVFLNKNFLHCYHNNRGYCSFGDKCRYQHYKEICSEVICRDQSCTKRHPVICKYREQCKFFKQNTCAFKHNEIKNKVENKDLEKKIEIYTIEMESLKHEISDLKNSIKIKENELLKRNAEIDNLNKIIVKKLQSEKDMIRENNIMKMKVETLERENKALNIKFELQDKTNDSENKLQLSNMSKRKEMEKFSCEKCCIKFSCIEELRKHKSKMHKVTLTF